MGDPRERASGLLLAAFGATVTDEGYENGLLVCRLAEAADRFTQALGEIQSIIAVNPAMETQDVHWLCEMKRAKDDMRDASEACRAAGLIKG